MKSKNTSISVISKSEVDHTKMVAVQIHELERMTVNALLENDRVGILYDLPTREVEISAMTVRHP